MSTTRQLLTAGMAVALTLGVTGRTAVAAPKGVGVRINCLLPAQHGGSSNTECKNLSGWFQGRLEWISGGQVLFEEEGPFVGLSGGSGEVEIFVDGNRDEKLFHRIYESTDPASPSLLVAPDLGFRLYTRSGDGTLTLVTEQRYYPDASAAWAVHSQDTFQIKSDLDAERAARTAGDQAFASQLVDEAKQRIAAQTAIGSAITSETGARKQEAAAALANLGPQLVGYAYSKGEIDAKVAPAGSSQGSPGASLMSMADANGAQVLSPTQALHQALNGALGTGLAGDASTARATMGLALQPDYATGSAYVGRFVKLASPGGETRIDSHLFVDGSVKMNGPIEINRPDGSIRIGHGSSIMELIGADPFMQWNAPSPTVYFSPDPMHQLLNTSPNPSQPNNVPQQQQVQFALLGNGSSSVELQNNPSQQVPVYGANNQTITTVGVLASQNAQLEAGPENDYVVSSKACAGDADCSSNQHCLGGFCATPHGTTGEVRLSGTLNGSLQAAYTGFKAPTNPSGGSGPQGSFLYTLPSAPAYDGQPWINDGSNTLLWTYKAGDSVGSLTDVTSCPMNTQYCQSKPHTVVAIQRQPVSATLPSVNGQIFDYDSTNNVWRPDSNLTLPGSATIKGSLGVGGLSTIGGNLSVTGGTTIGGTLGVTGATTLHSTLAVGGAATIGGTLGVTGASSLSNTLYVSGTTTLNGAASLNNTLAVTGFTQVNNNLTATGNTVIGGTLAVTGNAALGSIKNVVGTTSLSGAVNQTGSTGIVTVNGATTLNNTLYVGGAATFNGAVTGINAGSTGQFGSLSATGDIVSTGGNVTAKVGGGFFGGTGSFGSNLTVGSSYHIQGDVGVGGGNLTVNGNGTFAGVLTAYAWPTTMVLSGNLSVGYQNDGVTLTGAGASTVTGGLSVGGNLNVNNSGNANISGNGVISSSGVLAVGAGGTPWGTWPRMYSTGTIELDGGWLRTTGTSGMYWYNWGGGWYMYDSTWIRAYNNRNIDTGGEVRGSVVRGTTQLCLNPDGTPCRTIWPGGFNCTNAGASGANHTCGGAENIGTVGWGGVVTRSDYLPGAFGNEHWYVVNFGSADFGTASPLQRGHVYFQSATSQYKIDVFYDCSGSVVSCDEGGLYDYVGHDSFDTDFSNPGNGGGSIYYSPNGTTYYVRVRALTGNRDCESYSLVFAND